MKHTERDTPPAVRVSGVTTTRVWLVLALLCFGFMVAA